MIPQYSKACVELTKECEGFVACPKPDPVGLPTVGYGHKCLPGEHYAGSLTESDASMLLASDLDEAWDAVNELVIMPINQNQVDALTDFVFNLGRERFAGSTLLKKINHGDFKGAADEFPKWNHAGGEVLPGLTVRRQKERELFLA